MHRPSRALLFLPVVAAVAGGPFAGDDSGFVPPSRSVAKCEEQVARSLASFDRCATGAPATDLDGQPRPQEGAFDIGADEFVP